MEISYLLNQMCHEVLSAVDIKAIRKARGFSPKETASPSTLENFFLTSIGLEQVIAGLSQKEIATLHLLKEQKEPVNIAFFERLYGSARRNQEYYYGTFPQQFRETLDAVKKTLVRQGILIMAEEKSRDDDSTQMERWRFVFPSEFVRFLPPLIPSPQVWTGTGEIRTSAWRAKLAKIVGMPPAFTGKGKDPFTWELLKGTLYLGGEIFSERRLWEWQHSMWEEENNAAQTDQAVLFSYTSALQIILKTLAEGQWAAPEQLQAALEVFCFGGKPLTPARLCETGWKWGCLARYSSGNHTYYCIPSVLADQETPEFDDRAYLVPSAGTIRVDLQTVPMPVLEQINSLAYLKVSAGELIALPDPVKLGRASQDVRQTSLAHWLHERIPAFQYALDTVAERWGKVIVHSNLLVARVRDLSLRVQLERTLGPALVVLNEEYVAFPEAERSEVDRLLKKMGFVVKEVNA